MAERETGKRRAKRIPTDYFKKPDALQRWKLRLTGLALILAIAWWVTGLDFAKGGRSSEVGDLRASHGTLAEVHSAWDAKCDACHVPFESLGSVPGLARSASVGAVSDQLCQSCHKGTTHHVAQIESEVKNCSGCHHDHNGREFRLAQVADTDCTNCHGNLTAHTDTARKPKGTKTYEGTITRFDLNHPDFNPSAYADKGAGGLVDKSNLKFNHKLHLNPGQPRKGDDKATMTLAKIAEGPTRERYRDITARVLGAGKTVADSELVRLDCAACHVLDATDFGKTPELAALGLPPRAGGKYMLKIDYENQCAACHTNKFDPAEPNLSVPHGKQPAEVVKFLRGVYADRVLGEHPELLAGYVPTTPLPGKPANPETSKLKDAFESSVKKAVDVVFKDQTNCKECHVYGGEAPPDGVPKSIVAPNVPQIWFKNSTFNHSAHQAVSCKECHAAAETSEKNSDYLLPDVKNCQSCHKPGPTNVNWLSVSKEKVGGVSHDCTECHRYHNGDDPLAGPGAKENKAAEVHAIQAFLREGPAAPKTEAPAAKAPEPSK